MALRDPGGGGGGGGGGGVVVGVVVGVDDGEVEGACGLLVELGCCCAAFDWPKFTPPPPQPVSASATETAKPNPKTRPKIYIDLTPDSNFRNASYSTLVYYVQLETIPTPKSDCSRLRILFLRNHRLLLRVTEAHQIRKHRRHFKFHLVARRIERQRLGFHEVELVCPRINLHPCA